MITTILANIITKILIFQEIIHYASWSIIIGIIIAVAIVFVLFIIIRGFYPQIIHTPTTLFIGVVLFSLLCIQSVPLCSTIALKMQIKSIEFSINGYVNSIEIPSEESSNMIEDIFDEHPILDIFIDSKNFLKIETSNLAQAITIELNRRCNNTIIKLLISCIITTALGATILIKTQRTRIKRRPIREYNSQRSYRNNRHRRIRIQTQKR